MTVGDLITRDGQYEFRTGTGDHSILFNSGEPGILMTKLDGLFGLPDFRGTDYPKQGKDGSVPGNTLYADRTLTGDVEVLANSESQMMQSLMDVMEAMQPDGVDGTLVFRKARLGTRLIYCRPLRAAFPSTSEVVHGRAVGAVQWVAHDPRIYSLYENTTTITLGPGVTSASENVYMGGNWRRGVPCKVEVNGPGAAPRISNAAHSGRTIKLTPTMPSNQTLLLDTGRLTVLDVGNDVSAVGYLARDSQWWELQKGDNAITVNRSSSTGTMVVKIYSRDAYVL